jgi:glycosyltransferase involved in cell wall biosynthesis
MSLETVSVVIPTYNRAYCVPRAIDSALHQTHSDVELIVVDDGSTDDTGQVIARRYGDEPRVRYVRQDNGGVCAARNHGFRLATGAVALLDSDDAWLPWKLELQLACLRAAPGAGMIWTDMAAVDPEGKVSHERYLRLMYGAYRYFPSNEALFGESRPLREVAPALADVVGENRLFVGDIFSAMVMGSLVHTSTVLLRRERRDRVGGFDESLAPSGEDYDFHLRTCREGPVAFADVPSLHYQLGLPDRLTRFNLPVARNFLRTVEGALRRDRDRIDLPPRMIRTVLHEAHRWLGEEQLEVGARWEAARHFASALRQRPTPRSAAMLAWALVPSPVASVVREGYRKAKTVLHGSGSVPAGH